MNTAHIAISNLKTANTAGGSAAAAGEAAPEGDAALAFVAMLGEEIDAAALLLGQSETPAEPITTEAPAQAGSIDPGTIVLQLNMQPAQTVALAPEKIEHDTAHQTELPPVELQGLSAKKTDKSEATGRPEQETLAVSAQESMDTAVFVVPKTTAATESKPATASIEASPASLALLQTGSQSTQRAADPVQTMNLSQPVGSERWNTELGQTVNLLIKGDQTRASLQVTPPEMGPIEIKINLSGDQASISFTVQQSDTRQALENALPRLREMLAESGISLGQSQVNQQSPGQTQGEAAGTPGSGFASANGPSAEENIPVRVRVGLVDTFA